MPSNSSSTESWRQPRCPWPTKSKSPKWKDQRMPGKMDCYGLADVGKVREVNEDQFLIADLNKAMLVHQTSLSHEDHTRRFGGSQGQLLLVADGMGGHAAGKQASTLAVQTLSHYVLNT